MLAGATLESRTLILVFSDSMFTPLYLISFQSWSTQERSRPAPPTHTSQPHLIPFSHSRGPQENRLANILCHPNLHPLRAQDGASDLAQLHETPWGGLDLPAPTSRELYRKGLRVTRHLLTIIFPSGLTVIIVQTCLGEKPGGARPDAPSWARLWSPREPRSRCGPKPGGRNAEGARGTVASPVCSPARGTARPGRAGQGLGESSGPGGLCVSALPASHFGEGEAARPQIAGRASACEARWLGGTRGAAARRRASRGGRPHSRGPRPRSRLEAAPGPHPGPPHLPAAPLCSLPWMW